MLKIGWRVFNYLNDIVKNLKEFKFCGELSINFLHYN